jgi:hypothetical protein
MIYNPPFCAILHQKKTAVMGRNSDMTVTKETIPIEATLTGEGRERKCTVRVSQCSTYEDEGAEPVFVSYSRCRIDDSDDFPDGEYQLLFDGHRLLLRKQAGQYTPLTSEKT